jgi:2-keto-4-pentenoate hydratase/2-oxohepta-3-ene-1,7-dioic acid hydratase in catechol pathway
MEKEVIPSKVICVGRNYVEHIHELNNEIPASMVLFNKPNSAITDKLYYIQKDCRFEAEICFLIFDNKIEGIGFGLDLTKADLQNYLKSKGLPWERAKAFDKSAVFGKFIKLEGDIKSLEMKLFVNDTLIQHATYDLMIYKPDKIVDEIQSFMSFEDGDIIMSGTPKGVSTYKVSDSFRGEIYIDNNMIIEEKFVVEGV